MGTGYVSFKAEGVGWSMGRKLDLEQGVYQILWVVKGGDGWVLKGWGTWRSLIKANVPL